YWPLRATVTYLGMMVPVALVAIPMAIVATIDSPRRIPGVIAVVLWALIVRLATDLIYYGLIDPPVSMRPQWMKFICSEAIEVGSLLAVTGATFAVLYWFGYRLAGPGNRNAKTGAAVRAVHSGE
ncbi:MAG TPA: hypothetical protein VFV87_06555, partial [Pirellulaceae bacterium]|nr:hypothetical protein [Pirellulaceae bacterium]